MATIETPSRILRRIQDQEQEEVPSLPSFPCFDTSGPTGNSAADLTHGDDSRDRSITSFSSHLDDGGTRITSTPLVPTEVRNPYSSVTAALGDRQTRARKSLVNSTRSSLLSNGTTQGRTYETAGGSASRGTELGASESVAGMENDGGLQEGSEATARPQGQDESSEEQLNEAQESFAATEAPFSDNGYEDYQVSVHSAPKPSPQDPFRNVSIRRRSSQNVPQLSHSPSDSSTSSGQAMKARPPTPIRPSAQVSASLSPPSEASPISRDASYMVRAFTKAPAAAPANGPNTVSSMTTPARTAPLANSGAPPLPSSIELRTPLPTTNAAARRRSYALSVLSTVSRPRIRGSPHPHMPTRGTPHPFGRTSLESPSFSPASASTPSTNNDLTTHPRANVSFDPATVDTRFNVAKMNTYLHTLNEKLVEENIILHQSLMGARSGSSPSGGSSITPIVRSSQGPEGEAVLEPSVSTAEEWYHVVAGLRAELDEANADRHRLNEEVQTLRANLDHAIQSDDSVKRKSQQDLASAQDQAERWKSKFEAKANDLKHREEVFQQAMSDAERGVEQLVADWERKVADRDQELQYLKEKVAGAQTDESDRITSLQKRLEEERAGKDAANTRHMTTVRGLQERISDLELAVKENEENDAKLESTLANVQQELQRAREQLEHTRVCLDDERAALAAKEEELDYVRSSLSDIAEELAASQDRIEELEARLSAKENGARVHDDDPENTWPSGLHDRSAVFQTREATIHRLEEELSEAHREIGKLKRPLLPSPSKSAVAQAHTERMQELEAEVVQLREAIQNLKTHPYTPARLATTDNPAVHKSVLTLRTPVTPGGPLKEWSWLQQSTHNQTDVAPFLAEIARLQEILEGKERNVDTELDELEVVLKRRNELILELEEERARNAEMELKATRMTMREATLARRLKTLKCIHCRRKFDSSHIMHFTEGGANESIDQIESSLDADPTVDTGTHREAIAKLNDELASAREQLIQEQRAQRDIAGMLEAQRRKTRDEVRSIKDEEHQKRALLQDELERARSGMNALRRDLETERNKYQSIRDEQIRAQREKNSVIRELEQKQKELDDTKARLQTAKHSMDKLGAQLQGHADVDTSAQMLAMKLAEAKETMARLRQDRTALLAERSDLQQSLDALHGRLGELRQARTKSEATAEKLRTQLESIASRHQDEIRELEEDKIRMNTERSDIKRTISGLEADLHYIRREAESFGRDLIRMQSEKSATDTRGLEELRRYKAQTSTQIRLLNEQLAHAQDKVQRLEMWNAEHVCERGEQEIADMKHRHKQECKGLALHIHYLKDLFRRESSFRSDLAYQKGHILTLLAVALKQPQRNILPTICRVTHTIGGDQSRRSIKSMAWSFVFLFRVRNATQKWREQRASRPHVEAALEEVRRRRVKT